jgi:hypothetical protein
LLPFIVWMFDTSVSSEISFASVLSRRFHRRPGLCPRLVHQTGRALALIWAYLHHLIAGIAPPVHGHVPQAVSKEFGRQSSAICHAGAQPGPDRGGAGRQSCLACTEFATALQQRSNHMSSVNYGSKRTVTGAHYGLPATGWCSASPPASWRCSPIIVLAQVIC